MEEYNRVINECVVKISSARNSKMLSKERYDQMVPGLLGPKPFRPGTPRPGRFGPFFNPGLLGPLKWDRSAQFFFIIFFLEGREGVIVLFCLCASKQDSRNFI